MQPEATSGAGALASRARLTRDDCGKQHHAGPIVFVMYEYVWPGRTSNVISKASYSCH